MKFASQRRKARQLAIQALYQWIISRDSLAVIEQQFLEDANPKKIDLEYFSEIIKGVVENEKVINENLSKVLDRDLTALNPVESAVLKAATYELLFRLEIPYKVIINEALEVTKIYGSQDGFKYVNAVLDQLAKLVR
jgi:transcription antitermination protein NusB